MRHSTPCGWHVGVCVLLLALLGTVNVGCKSLPITHPMPLEKFTDCFDVVSIMPTIAPVERCTGESGRERKTAIRVAGALKKGWSKTLEDSGVAADLLTSGNETAEGQPRVACQLSVDRLSFDSSLNGYSVARIILKIPLVTIPAALAFPCYNRSLSVEGSVRFVDAQQDETLFSLPYSVQVTSHASSYNYRKRDKAAEATLVHNVGVQIVQALRQEKQQNPETVSHLELLSKTRLEKRAPSPAVPNETAPELAQGPPKPVSPSPENPPSPSPPPLPNVVQTVRWAVVVGISDYRDSRIPILRYAAADARAFHDWLLSPTGGRYAPANVKLLLNQEATGANIRSALFEWLKRSLAEDAVTIYFAGHGSPESPDNTKNLFLLPYDTDFESIAATAFPMWDIQTALERFIQARKVIVIADVCHAGGVGQGFEIARRAARSVEVEATQAVSSGLESLSRLSDGVCVISASSDQQKSQEGQQWGGGHGVFTHFLLKGLQGDADYNKDSSVNLGEIVPYLSQEVRRETANAQSPVVSGRYDPALAIGR